MFKSPVTPVTPTKSPNQARRGDQVRRRLTWHSQQTPRQQTSQSNIQQLTEDNIAIGTFVTTPSAGRQNDMGVILAHASGGNCEVLWQSDKTRTQVMYNDLRIWDPNAPKQTGATVTPVAKKSKYKHKYKRLISGSKPEGLVCPLNSTNAAKIEQFQMRFDNYLFSGHPNVEKVVLGSIDNPIQYCDEFVQLMRTRCAPNAFVFDPRKTNEYLDIVRVAKPELLPKLEFLLDGEMGDGYRQVNKAIYNATIECIHEDDSWVWKSVERNDGIGLRNLLWEKMEGGDRSQRTIAAMQTKMNLDDIYYRFQTHGIGKYFAKVHSKLGKLSRLGRVMDKMTALSAIFQHLGGQCLEYREEADKLRSKFVEDQESVTLKSAQLAFIKVESTHGLGTTSKGTPIPASTPMSGPSTDLKQIPAKISGFAGTKAHKAAAGTPEAMAESNYGAKGSHPAGSCPVWKHRNHTNHCYAGCTKCGGCYIYHKRQSLIKQGLKPCTYPKHKHTTHLESECNLIKQERENAVNKSSTGRGRHKGNTNRRNQHNDESSRQQHRRARNRVSARSSRAYFDRVERFARSRSRSRSFSRDRSPDRHRKYRSPPRRDLSPTRRSYSPTRRRDHYRSDRDRRRPSGSAAFSAAYESVRDRSVYSKRRSSSRSDYSNHRSRGREAGRNQSGLNDDGRYKQLARLPAPLCPHRHTLMNLKPTRRVVSYTAGVGVQADRRTVLDSGAGRPVIDSDELYNPRSKRAVDAEIVWGDGSTHPVKYEGDVGPFENCVNTGGAADADLLGVGSMIDSLQKKFKRKITVVFDEASAYIFKDVDVRPLPRKRGRFALHQRSSTSGMLTANREPGDTGIYIVPTDREKPRTSSSRQQREVNVDAKHQARSSKMKKKKKPLLTKRERDLAVPAPPPCEIVFDGKVERMTRNKSNMERDIMRLHTSWGHVGPRVLKHMLDASGTQKHKRLAKKLHELAPICNACLEGRSQAQPHSRDHEQPTSKATRPLQRICADSTGKSNIPTLGGHWYAYLHSCQYTGYSWLWMIASLTQVKPIVEDWLRTVVKQKRRLKLCADDTRTSELRVVHFK